MRLIILILMMTLFRVAAAGSLYRAADYQSLTADVRARKVGDLLTVMVYESASASTAAGTTSGRDASVGFELNGTGKDFRAGLNTANQVDGRGRTAREGRVLAQITVVVTAVYEGGDLAVAGEQVLDINHERQQIGLEGRVRPQDVSPANVVLSTRVANAKIRYAGQGDMADKQRPAWWQRFVSLFGI